MRKSLAQFLTHLSLYVQVIGRAGIGYPRVIPKPESKFGHGLGWVCVWIPWVFSGWVPKKAFNFG